MAIKELKEICIEYSPDANVVFYNYILDTEMDLKETYAGDSGEVTIVLE